jgi:hypothetical protein
MKPIEIVLTVANAFVLFGLAVPLHRRLLWMRDLPPIVFLTALAQVVFEGPRWQTIPSYVLTGLLCVVWVLQFKWPLDMWRSPVSIRLIIAIPASLLLISSFILPRLFPLV